MVSRLAMKEVRALLGDPKVVARELSSFRKSAQVLSSQSPRLIDRYPRQWVAVYERRVRATGKTLRSLMTQVEKKELPKNRIIVRYIDKNQRTLIF